MNKRVHCGRLILNKSGGVKKVHLQDGGGTRDCIWNSIDTDFDDMHEQLREKFSIDPKKKSWLYDFQRQQLDKERFPTFLEYVNKNGLQFNGTLLYLCTSANDSNNSPIISTTTPTKKKITVAVAPQVVQYPPQPKKKVIPQVEADSSTSPVLIKIDDEPERQRRRINESPLSNHFTENLQISSSSLSSTSFSDYSFEKSLNELVDYLRNLITRNTREILFIQIFEHICTIRGLSSITLDRLKQQLQSAHNQQQQEQEIYNDVLEQIEKLARSVKTSIELNKMKLAHNNHYSIFMDLFGQFHRNFNILRDQWINHTKSNRTSTYSSAMNRSANSTSSSSHSVIPSSSRHHHEINPAPAASFSSTSNSVTPSSSRYHRETNPAPSTSFSSSHSVNLSSSRHHHDTNLTPFSSSHSVTPSSSRHHHETNPAPSTYISSSSHSVTHSASRNHHETNSRKQARALSRSPHRSSSSHRASTDADRKERHAIFEEILKSLDDLLYELYHRDFMSFYYVVQSIVDEIKSIRSNIKLSDHQSLRDAEKLIESIDGSLTKRINDEYNRAAPYGINRQFENKCTRTLNAIRHIITSFHYYQAKVHNNNKRRKKSSHHRSSPLPTSSSVENKPVVNIDQKDIKMDNDDDDQSSEASHSSFGDEVLMEVAKDAYEQRPNSNK